MKRKMPSEETRLKRIDRNFKALPKKQAQNIKKASRSAEIIRHATGTASGGGFGHQARNIKKK